MQSRNEVAVLGPLSGLAAPLSDYLSALGYSPLSIELRLRLLAHVSRWLRDEGLDPSEFDGPRVEGFLAVRRQTHRDLVSPGSLEPIMVFLRSLGVVPLASVPAPASGPVDAVLRSWAEYLRRERGFQADTTRNYQFLVRPLLESRELDGELDLAELTAADVSTFVGDRIPALSPGVGKLTLSALRSLLRYLFVTGKIRARLDSVVPARAWYRDSGLPRWLPPGDVAALVEACDITSLVGRRDRAIILVLARLGLRAGEVSTLMLEDLDWRSGTVRVRGKGGYLDLMPVPADVGAALAAYLSGGRPRSATERAVFLRSLAPVRALSANGISTVVRRAGLRAGIGPVGSHRLRHSVATAAINAGATLEEIAQLLRHRSLDSTAIYAKVDVAHLALLARPWPGTVRTPYLRVRRVQGPPVLSTAALSALRNLSRPWPGTEAGACPAAPAEVWS